MDSKKCSTCKEVKPVSDFHKCKANKDGLQTSCKVCKNRAARKWQQDNPERHRAIWQKSYAKKSVEQRRAERYGISVEELQALINREVCDICGKKPERRLVIDHCHREGNVRGVLCDQCNTALGLLDDDVERMRKAIEYINA